MSALGLFGFKVFKCNDIFSGRVLGWLKNDLSANA